MRDGFMKGSRICPECNKEFSLFWYDKQNYVYKVIHDGNHVQYLCSYPCYRKYKAKLQGKER